MIARASASGSIESRCWYQPIAWHSSSSEAQSRAKVRVSAESSSGGSWYWSNPIVAPWLVRGGAGQVPALASLLSRFRQRVARFPGPAEQFDVLADRGEVERFGLGAELRGRQFVLGLEDRLIGLDEGLVVAAFVELEALLDDREVEVADQLPRLLRVVLQRHRHPPRVDLVGDPAVVAELIGAGEREAGVVFPAGDVVGLDRVEALLRAEIEPLVHDRREAVEVTDVEPTLVRKAFVALAQDRFREPRGVGPVFLPAADVDITDRLGTVTVDRADV